ncbi:MAG: molybdopterin molybdotransferase MoeA [Gemmatimonadaceae bacterium]|nr:molybdopterin molybdotransferase MoeA [Gemmatimonadaceae bacterium]
MISVADASARILERIDRLPSETVALSDAVNRTFAERVVAPVTSPPWDNASMDGYAARSADLPPAGSATAVRLRVVANIAAGQFPPRALNPGEAMRIMTGAPIPENADSVIRHEDTDNGSDTVAVSQFRDAGKNVRRAGEDFRAGDVLFDAGEQLRIAHLGVLASAGAQTVDVYRRPRVAIISSGDELVELADYTPAMAGKRIVSSNSVTLSAMIRDAGGVPVDLGIASDSVVSVRTKFQQAQDCNLIVTSAGLSVGDHDHVRSAFDYLGGQLVFWKVKMRPGAPLAFGMLGAIPWVGVSGNPVSAMVSFEVFVRPVLRKMLGLDHIFRRTIPVVVAEAITLGAPLMHFLRVVVERSTDGRFVARSAGSQSSAVVTSMARANALLILPGDVREVRAGETHRALPLGETLEMTSQLCLQ